MKLSNLILLSIISIAFFYIQLWDHRIVIPLYLTLLGANVIYATALKNTNMAHISGFIFLIYSINYMVFKVGLINYVTPEDNKLLQGTLIYGTHFIFSLILVLVLIFRVQLSRLISKSESIELTHFDGIFHWIYIYTSIVYLLALVENIAWSYFDLKSWTLIYDNFEGLIYIAWALCCGALLTMMICSKKPTNTNELA
ncbi:hypothetical protein [Pseudoalteromonas sp. T1lg23B]|uniref:hypothetical protein n=1 Tax=Pseudoalteromonas sp. T1lg23B TaxID=2077097 RepID=UPI000CF7307A|nr:hypothetical protein [Pseudoalteromonas sp. T1lg23B]